MKSRLMPKLQVSQVLASLTLSTALCTWFGEQRLLALPGLFVLTLAAALSQQFLPPKAGVWSRYLLVLSGLAMSVLLANFVSVSLSSLAINSALMFVAFLVGLRVGSGEWQHHQALGVFGIGLLVFALPMLMTPSLSEGMLLAGIYITSGLLAVSSCREEEETYLVRSRGVQLGSGHSRFIVSAGLLVLLFLGLILVGERVTALLPQLGKVLSFVLERLFIVFWPLLTLLEKLFSRIQLPEEQDIVMPSLPMQPGEEVLQEELAPALNFPIWVGNTILVVGVCALLYLIARSIKLSRPGVTSEEEPPEERESVFSLPHMLNTVFRRRRLSGRRQTAATPRSAVEVYAKLLYHLARTGRIREKYQTAQEFACEASNHLPQCAPEIEQVSGAMELELYGEEHTTYEMLTELNACVNRIAQVHGDALNSQGK